MGVNVIQVLVRVDCGHAPVPADRNRLSIHMISDIARRKYAGTLVIVALPSMPASDEVTVAHV